MMKTINIFKTFLLSLLLTFGLGVQSQVSTFPHTSDFEGSMGDWVNVLGDNGDWGVDANGTPSVGTGPSVAQSGSYYIFTETSGSATWGGQIWLQCTYDFSTLTDASIDFWYHKWASNHPGNGPGSLGLDVSIDGGNTWTYDVFRDDNTSADQWKNANVDLSAYAGQSNVILSWTNYVATPQGWQCDIALDNIVVDGTGSGGGGPPCATLDYTQDFETGVTSMTATTQTQSSAYLDALSANGSLYGLHMEGNLNSYWYTPYTTGAGAFGASPLHIASVSRDICASTETTLELTFDKMQTYTWNVNYCWFRLTIDGVPVSDINGNTYFNGSNNTWETLEYDLSAYANMDFTVAWESCAKYYTGYTVTGMGGDAVYIDNISLTETAGVTPPSTPGTISGNDYPNADALGTYTISPVANATSYTWTVPSGWSINSGQGGTSITVTTGSTDGSVTVYASNSGGNSSTQGLSTTTAERVTSYPYTTAFESESQDLTTASATGFTFNEAGWRNVDGDDGDWRTDAGGTGSSNSGPGGGASSGQSDHYPGTSAGKYIYTEASSPMFPSKIFELWSPPYNLTSLSVPTFTFWYSLYSVSGASLSIQASTDDGVTWSNDIAFMCPTISQTAEVNINMGTNWRQGFIDLDSYKSETNIMFRFKVVTGSSFDGDVCLDDIKLVDAQNTSVDVGENISLDANSYSNAYGLVLNGSAAQTITSNGYNISNVTINNSNGVIIDGNITIDNLTLTNGHITMGNGNILTTDAISGTWNANSHIIGLLKRTSSNTSVKVFPIGDGTNYRPVSLIPQTSTNSEYTAIYNNVEHSSVDYATYPNGTPTGAGLHSIANGYFWDIEKGVGSTPARIGIDWDATMNVTAPNDIVVAHYNSATSQWENIMGSNLASGTAASGTAMSDYASDFSPFGFGSQNGGNALPIDLISFTGAVIDGNAVLEWEVASQVNNDYYTIERSIDCENWEEISSLKGAGSTNQLMKYTTYDEKPYVGVSYYRLTQTDYDGKFETFIPISIIYDKPIRLSINPNPVEEKLNLYLGENLRGMTNVTIVNSRGQVIYKKGFLGEYKMINLQVGEYRRGYYLLEVDHNQRVGTLKFIKE